MNEPQKRIYRCDKGHEIVAEGFTTFTMQRVSFQEADGKITMADYNFCPFCFYAAAEAQFPLREVTPLES